MVANPGPFHPRRSVRLNHLCTACGNCIATCPPRALLPGPRRPTVVDSAGISCGECIEVCPVGAISEISRPEEVVG